MLSKVNECKRTTPIILQLFEAVLIVIVKLAISTTIYEIFPVEMLHDLNLDRLKMPRSRVNMPIESACGWFIFDGIINVCSNRHHLYLAV